MLRKVVAAGTGIAFRATLHVLSWALYQLDPDPWAGDVGRLHGGVESHD